MRIITFGIISIFSVLLFSSGAFADTLSLPTQIIQSLIPPGNSQTPFGSAIFVYLSQVLMPGAALFMTYHTIMGIVHTAHEGKILGNYHQVMSPLKICCGIGLMVPISGGLCGIQIGIAEIAKLGSDAATKIQSAYVDGVVSGYGGVPNEENGGAPPSYHPLGLPLSESALALARQILTFETCRESYRVIASASNYGAGVAWLPGGAGDYVPAEPPAAGLRNPSGEVVWLWGQCGAMLVAGQDTNAVVRPAAVFSVTLGQQAFMSARLAAISALVQGIRDSELPHQVALGQQPGSGVSNPTNLIATMRPLADQYNQSMLDAGAEFLNKYSPDRAKISVELKKDWSNFGIGWMIESEMSAQVTAISAVTPTIVGPDVSDSVFNRTSTRDVARTLSILKSTWDHEAGADAVVSGTMMAGIADERSDFITGTLQKLLNPLSEWMTNEFGKSDPNKAVKSMVDYGHRCMQLAVAMLGASSAGVFAAGNAVGQATGALALFQYLSPISYLIIGAVLVCAYLNAFIIPMIPYFASIAVVTGWACYLIEAMIISPIWCLWAVRLTGGSEFICDALKPGAMSILKLAFIPILSVLAFDATSYILPVVLALIDSGFSKAFYSAQGGHSIIFGTVVAMSIHSWVKYQAVIRVFGLVVEIPGRLANWLGSARDSHGESQMLREIQQGGSGDGSGAMSLATGRAEAGASKVSDMKSQMRR